MNCSRCGKDAQKYIRRTEDNREITLYLCPACYEHLYPAGQLGDILTPRFGDSDEIEKKCPHCGTTLLDFRRTGLLGCAYCYTAFRKELIPAVQHIQGEIQHRGKAQSEDAVEIYDMVCGLVKEQEMEKERLRRAKERGDTAGAARAQKRLAEIAHRLGEET